MLTTANSLMAMQAKRIIPRNSRTSPKLTLRAFKIMLTSAATNTKRPLNNGSVHKVHTAEVHNGNARKSSGVGVRPT